MLFGCILPRGRLSQLESVVSDPAPAFPAKAARRPKPGVSRQPSPRRLGWEEAPWRGTALCSPTGSSPAASRLPPAAAAVQPHLQPPCLTLVFLLFCHICGDSLHWSREPLESSRGVGSNFFQAPVTGDILTSPPESQLFLLASRMGAPSRRVFSWLCPDPSEESHLWKLEADQMSFLSSKS